MHLRGLRLTPSRGGKAIEYAVVILTVTIIIVLAGWFLGHEIARPAGSSDADHAHGPSNLRSVATDCSQLHSSCTQARPLSPSTRT